MTFPFNKKMARFCTAIFFNFIKQQQQGSSLLNGKSGKPVTPLFRPVCTPSSNPISRHRKTLLYGISWTFDLMYNRVTVPGILFFCNFRLAPQLPHWLKLLNVCVVPIGLCKWVKSDSFLPKELHAKSALIIFSDSFARAGSSGYPDRKLGSIRRSPTPRERGAGRQNQGRDRA